MFDSLMERIRKVLHLEQESGWSGRTITGGFQARDVWEVDTRRAGLESRLVRQIVQRLRQYETASPGDRPNLAQQLRGLLQQPTADPALAQIDQLDSSAAGRTVTEPSGPVAPPGPTPSAARRRSSSGNSILDAHIETLKGIGPTTSEKLSRLGIETIEDLIWHLPHRHDDYSTVRKIDEMQSGESLAVVACLEKVNERKLSMRRSLTEGIFNDGTGTLRASWFNQPWKAKQLKTGKLYRLMGRVDLYMGRKTLSSPEIEPIKGKTLAGGMILPVYPLTEGLKSSSYLGRLIERALRHALSEIQDPLPESIKQQFSLVTLQEALQQIHSPETLEQLAAARKRLAFDELFAIQLGVQRRRQLLMQTTAPSLPFNGEWLRAYTESLPFALTGAQERVVREITLDVARTVPMSRLVQGDVGSGKTAVAAGAMYMAAGHNSQSALLAPTQILAEQHYRGLTTLFQGLAKPDGTPVRVALLTGRVSGQEREEVLSGLAEGTIDVAVGTTALIQEGVHFRNLALVVVDEQHRFGVEQRGALRSRSSDSAQEENPNGLYGGELADAQASDSFPHMLVMSATPIPRSLALTIYGDLDVSVIDELPPGRQEIKTKLFAPAERERLYGFVRRQVQKGQQAYIIYPLVEESEKLDAGAAVESYQRLSEVIFPDLRLGLIHGRLSGSEKDAVMRRFAEGEIDVLVSTSVIEVGIDVANATVMLIEDADRFGLAQLHQFRGRVGRGSEQSYCALISGAQNGPALERLDALASTTDGFALAEFDLDLRGPGEFLGTRQSGLPALQMAQLSDVETLAQAQKAARLLFEEDPELSAHPHLRAKVERFWHGHGDIN